MIERERENLKWYNLKTDLKSYTEILIQRVTETEMEKGSARERMRERETNKWYDLRD